MDSRAIIILSSDEEESLIMMDSDEGSIYMMESDNDSIFIEYSDQEKHQKKKKKATRKINKEKKQEQNGKEPTLTKKISKNSNYGDFEELKKMYFKSDSEDSNGAYSEYSQEENDNEGNRFKNNKNGKSTSNLSETKPTENFLESLKNKYLLSDNDDSDLDLIKNRKQESNKKEDKNSENTKKSSDEEGGEVIEFKVNSNNKPAEENTEHNESINENQNCSKNSIKEKRSSFIKPTEGLDDFFVSNLAKEFILHDSSSSSEEEIINERNEENTKEEDIANSGEDSFDSLDEQLGIHLKSIKSKKENKPKVQPADKSMIQFDAVHTSPSKPKRQNNKRKVLRASSPPPRKEAIITLDSQKSQKSQPSSPKESALDELEDLDPELKKIYEQMNTPVKKKAKKQKNKLKCKIRCNFPLIDNHPVLAKNWHKSIEFKIKLDDDFQLLMLTIAEKKKTGANDLAVEYKQVRVYPFSTPESLGIESDQTISFDVYPVEVYDTVLINRQQEKENKLLEIEKDMMNQIFKPTEHKTVERRRIFIKPPKGEKMLYNMNIEKPISLLLTSLKEKLKIPHDNFRLEFDGETLDPELILKDSELENDDMLDLWIKDE